MEIADVTIVPVPTGRKASYLEFSKRMAAVYRDRGATRVDDYWQLNHPTDQSDFHADGVTYESDERRSEPAAGPKSLGAQREVPAPQ